MRYSGERGLMKKGLIVAIALVMFLACVGTVSADLISNGGFESPVVGDNPNWLWFPDGTSGMVWHIERGIGAQSEIVPVLEIQTQKTLGLVPYEGKQYTELDSHANVNISQTIKTEKGVSYQISYAQSCRFDDPHLPSAIDVYVNEQKVLTTSEGKDQTDGCTQWQVHSVAFTGTGNDVTLKFAADGVSDQYGPLLDGVDVEDPVTPSPAPEFPSLAFPVAILVGFIGIIMIIQKSKQY